MKLSFIIGAFNRPGRLRTCLASIADQTFTDWEAIVCDNSDDARCVVQQWAECENMRDPRIRYEHIGKRSFDPRINIRSLYTAAEIGVSMTTGEWLTFPNDDSYFCPWFAERMIQFAEESRLEFAYCDFVQGRPDLAHRYFCSEPRGGMIDKTNFIVKREWFPKEWPGKIEIYGMADGVLVNELVAKGIRHGKLNQTLCVHN